MKEIFITGAISIDCTLHKATGLEKNYYACMKKDGNHIGLLWLSTHKLKYIQTHDGQKMYSLIER